MLALVTVKNPDAEQPGWDDLYEIGTAAVVHKMIRVPDGTLRILVQGVGRIKLDAPGPGRPVPGRRVHATCPTWSRRRPSSRRSPAASRTSSARLISLVPYLPAELELAAANVDDPSALSHLVASTLRLKTEEKQALLEQPDVYAAAARRAPRS